MTFLHRTLSVSLALTVALFLIGPGAVARQRDAAISQRIADLSSRLQKATTTSQERDDVAAAIRNEVRQFVESSLSPSTSSELLEQKLRSVLQTQVPDFEFSDPPTIRVSDVRYGRSVVVAYSVIRPPHFDSPTITGFSDTSGKFAQTASIGNDFEGHTLFTKVVPSASKDVLWLLAGGKAFTFNGSKFRFRLYAFDGARFETVWAPEDVLDATVQVLVDGFSITHYDREQRSSVIEQYRTTGNGFERVR